MQTSDCRVIGRSSMAERPLSRISSVERASSADRAARARILAGQRTARLVRDNFRLCRWLARRFVGTGLTWTTWRRPPSLASSAPPRPTTPSGTRSPAGSSGTDEPRSNARWPRPAVRSACRSTSLRVRGRVPCRSLHLSVISSASRWIARTNRRGVAPVPQSDSPSFQGRYPEGSCRPRDSQATDPGTSIQSSRIPSRSRSHTMTDGRSTYTASPWYR